jgi:hypothetical protein
MLVLLGRLGAGFSLRRIGFNPRWLYVRLILVEMALEQVSSWFLRVFTLSINQLLHTHLRTSHEICRNPHQAAHHPASVFNFRICPNSAIGRLHSISVSQGALDWNYVLADFHLFVAYTTELRRWGKGDMQTCGHIQPLTKTVPQKNQESVLSAYRV